MPSVKGGIRSDAKHRCKCGNTTIYQCRIYGHGISSCVLHDKRQGIVKRKRASKYMPLKDRFELNIFYSPDGCWYWLGTFLNNGYGIIRLNYAVIGAHRVSYELYKGPIPDGLFVLHTCDNKLCVNPNHLYAGTHMQNMMDALERGRFHPVKGSNHCRAKVNEEDVFEIRASEKTTNELAEIYNVTPRAIAQIKDRTNWKHL